MRTFYIITCVLALILSYQIIHAQRSLLQDESGAGKTSQDSEVIFELIESIKFADGTEVKLSLKMILIPFGTCLFVLNHGIDGVTLSNSKVGKIHVRTCREYDEARKKGYYPMSTFDITMAMFFKKPCGLLNALSSARKFYLRCRSGNC